MAFNYSSLFLNSRGILQTPPSGLTVAGTSSGATAFVVTNMNLAPGKYVLCGALTANTYATVVSISGSGVLYFAGAGAVDATSRTITSRILIDGVQIVEGAGASSATNTGFALAGYYYNQAAGSLVAIPFSSSLTIDVKTDITEAGDDKVFVKYMASTI